MVTVPLGVSAFKRTDAGTPEIRLINRFMERMPTNLIEKFALLARPGTTELETFGAGPVRKVFMKPGVFDDDLFVVSGTTLYRYDGAVATAVTGTITGTDNPYTSWMKGIGYEYLWISDGLTLQYYDGAAALLGTSMPEVGEVPKALTALGSYVLVSVGNTQKFYWIQPGAVIIDALDFASKESNPDNILDMLTVGDQALLMGNGSTETWYATGDADAPFAPTSGRVFARGIMEGTPVVVNEAAILVGNDGIVYEIAGGVRRISTHGIEERIRIQRAREA